MTPEPFLVRRAVLADAAILTPLAAKLFHETYVGNTPAVDLAEYIAKSFRLELQQAEIMDVAGAVFLAEAVSNRTALGGYAHVQFPAGKQKPPFLNRLYVVTECKGTGLARRLLAEVIRECQRLQADRLQLTVFERNTRAINFYKRAGFAVTGAATFAVGNETQTDIEMELPIAIA